jgi:hypothetical protein
MTEEQKFLEAINALPEEDLMPTPADEAEFAALWDAHQNAVAIQESQMAAWRDERFVG